MAKHEQPADNAQPIFPEAFDLEEPERIFINPNATREELEDLSGVLTIMGSKRIREHFQEIAKNKEEQ